VIEQAKGIVAERTHVGIDTAFELLRGYARTHNHLLRQTAQEIIDGILSTDALTGPRPSKSASPPNATA
jgi:hypothetical protein